MPKLKRKSVAQKLREQRSRSAIRRQDTTTRELEQIVNTQAHRTRRQNHEVRVVEQERNTAAHTVARQDPEFRTPERERDTEAHRARRQNLEVRLLEQQRDTAAHCSARQNPEFRIPEKERDAEARSIWRQNPEVRLLEQERDTAAHNIARQYPEFRIPERKRDKEGHSSRRQVPEVRLLEQERDTAARGIARQNPEFRVKEKDRDTEARRIRRQNSEVKIREKERDAKAHRAHRENPEFRTIEIERDAVSRSTKRRIQRSKLILLIEQFNKIIRKSPSYICSCCGRLWYKDSTSKTSEELLRMRGCNDEFVAEVLQVRQQQHRLCGTCKRSIHKHKTPKLCLSNGFTFPSIPDVLKDLSPLEERLVALRIPFMQIRLLGAERQSSLRGNVVNVENDLDVCAQILPRSFDNTSTVQVQLMRRMKYNAPYMHETIRPAKVFQAAKYLVATDLYANENVLLSDDWRGYKEDEILDYICSDIDNTSAMENSTVENEDVTENDDVSIAADFQDGAANTVKSPEEIENLGADETLMFRENDVNIQGIRIAPGEGKIPIALFRDIHAEELSFPTIYAGKRREFKDLEKLKVSYTDIAKSEITRYDRRACRPSKILYAFKKSFNEKVSQAIHVCMRKRVGTTAANARSPDFVENLMHRDNGYAVFKNLRSSPSYWREKTKSVLAMTRQEGNCTFFMTFSAAETKWNELLVMLMKIVKQIDISEEDSKNFPKRQI